MLDKMILFNTVLPLLLFREEVNEEQWFKAVSTFACSPTGYVGCKGGNSYCIYRYITFVNLVLITFVLALGFTSAKM